MPHLRIDLGIGEKLICSECNRVVVTETVYLEISKDSEFNDWYSMDDCLCKECHDATH